MNKPDKYVLSQMVMGRYERVLSDPSKKFIDVCIKQFNLKQYSIGPNSIKFVQKETDIEFILEWD